MTVRDSAVLFFVLGLLTGMIVAFASCGATSSDNYRHQPHSQELQPQLTGADPSA
ncbi:MAG: hypothetical protein ACOYB7_05520 [Mycobacterium sp.]